MPRFFVVVEVVDESGKHEVYYRELENSTEAEALYNSIKLGNMDEINHPLAGSLKKKLKIVSKRLQRTWINPEIYFETLKMENIK
ncbi:MAG: hypothetical protein ACP5GU_07105 [Thermoprotei archaeon]|jgi:hypothetical protein